jgi:hypothetical protein
MCSLKKLLPTGNVGQDFKRDVVPFSKGKREAFAKAPPVDTTEQDQIDAENQAADAANLQVSENRRRRRLSSLFAGGRSVLGAPAGAGAPAGGGYAGGGGGSPVTSSAIAGGSALRGGSRSYGGAGRTLQY